MVAPCAGVHEGGTHVASSGDTPGRLPGPQERNWSIPKGTSTHLLSTLELAGRTATPQPHTLAPAAPALSGAAAPQHLPQLAGLSHTRSAAVQAGSWRAWSCSTFLQLGAAHLPRATCQAAVPFPAGGAESTSCHLLLTPSEPVLWVRPHLEEAAWAGPALGSCALGQANNPLPHTASAGQAQTHPCLFPIKAPKGQIMAAGARLSCWFSSQPCFRPGLCPAPGVQCGPDAASPGAGISGSSFPWTSPSAASSPCSASSPSSSSCARGLGSGAVGRAWG